MSSRSQAHTQVVKVKKLVFSKLETKRYRKQVQRTPVESFRCTKTPKNTFFIDFLFNQDSENCIKTRWNGSVLLEMNGRKLLIDN